MSKLSDKRLNNIPVVASSQYVITENSAGEIEKVLASSLAGSTTISITPVTELQSIVGGNGGNLEEITPGILPMEFIGVNANGKFDSKNITTSFTNNTTSVTSSYPGAVAPVPTALITRINISSQTEILTGNYIQSYRIQFNSTGTGTNFKELDTIQISTQQSSLLLGASNTVPSSRVSSFTPFTQYTNITLPSSFGSTRILNLPNSASVGVYAQINAGETLQINTGYTNYFPTVNGTMLTTATAKNIIVSTFIQFTIIKL